MVRFGPWCALALLLTLSACAAPGSGPAPAGRTTVSGVYVGDPTLLPMAVSLIVAEPDAAPLALTPAQVVELAPGLHVLATTVLPASGALQLDLPFADELPDAVRVPAPGVLGGDLPDGCTVQASSATVRVTPVEMATPLGNFVGFTPLGPRALALTPSLVNWADPGLDTLTLLTWVHADGPVAFTSAGTCSTATLDVVVDLELARGWNRVGFRIDVLGGGRSARTLANDDGELVFVSLLGA